MSEAQLPFGRLDLDLDHATPAPRSAMGDQDQLPFGRLVDDGSFSIATDRCESLPTRHVNKPLGVCRVAAIVGLSVLFTTYFFWRVITFYEQCRQLHTGLGATYLIGIAILTSALVYLVVRSWHRYRRLLGIERMQQLTILLQGSRESAADRRQLTNQIDQYLGRLEVVGAGYDAGLPAAIGRLRQRLREHDDPLRAVDQLDEFVLARIDTEVDAVIQRRAVETAAATALASGILDGVVLCCQTVRLIDEVAGRYGSRPGWLGTALLLRRGITMALFAEVTEQATELIAEAAANKTAATIGGRVAQGISNGLLILRFGDAVKRQCRPVPCQRSQSALSAFITAVWQLTVGRTTQSVPTEA